MRFKVFVFCKTPKTSNVSQGHASKCGSEALERTRYDRKPVVMDTSALELVGSSHGLCNACEGTRMLELNKNQNVYGLSVLDCAQCGDHCYDDESNWVS